MDMNGVRPRVEEPEEAQTAVVQGQQQQIQEQPGPSVQGQPIVDQRIFVHAPHYHWHQEGGVDQEAYAAIKKLHKDTHSFAQETICHGDKLWEDVNGLTGLIQ